VGNVLEGFLGQFLTAVVQHSAHAGVHLHQVPGQIRLTNGHIGLFKNGPKSGFGGADGDLGLLAFGNVFANGQQAGLALKFRQFRRHQQRFHLAIGGVGVNFGVFNPSRLQQLPP
jgi:hypothetical protein